MRFGKPSKNVILLHMNMSSYNIAQASVRIKIISLHNAGETFGLPLQLKLFIATGKEI
jgi:hypothetical protein